MEQNQIPEKRRYSKLVIIGFVLAVLSFLFYLFILPSLPSSLDPFDSSNYVALLVITYFFSFLVILLNIIGLIISVKKKLKGLFLAIVGLILNFPILINFFTLLIFYLR